MSVVDAVRAWIVALLESNMFCPADSERGCCPFSNLSPYICSPATQDFAPLQPGAGGFPGFGVLRVPVEPPTQQQAQQGRQPRDRHQQQDANDKSGGSYVQRNIGPIAEKVAAAYGADLYRFCHMGKEASVYMHALHYCTAYFRPDFRSLLECPQALDTQRHLYNLGIGARFPALVAHAPWPGPVSPDTPPFAQHFSFKHPMSDTPRSRGLGVHIWQLLTMASLLGSANLHPKCASDFARSVLGLILARAPRAATPGNTVPVRSFNVTTGAPEFVVVPADTSFLNMPRRVDHFVRARTDEGFTLNGEFTYCRAVHRGKLLPEDTLHCAHLVAAARLYACPIHKLPVKSVHGYYQLLPKVPYPIYRDAPGAEARGVLRVTPAGVVGSYTEQPAGTTVNFAYDLIQWQDELAAAGFLVLPVFMRAGVAIAGAGDGTSVACVLPAPDADADASFQPSIWGYNTLVVADQATGEDVHEHVDAIQALERVVPVGTTLWIRPRGGALWDSMRERLPLHFAEADRDRVAVRCRLNVPGSAQPEPGKLYVTYMETQRVDRGSRKEGRSVAVAPDEVLLLPPDDTTFLRALDVLCARGAAQ